MMFGPTLNSSLATCGPWTVVCPPLLNCFWQGNWDPTPAPVPLWHTCGTFQESEQNVLRSITLPSSQSAWQRHPMARYGQCSKFLELPSFILLAPSQSVSHVANPQLLVHDFFHVWNKAFSNAVRLPVWASVRGYIVMADQYVIKQSEPRLPQ